MIGKTIKELRVQSGMTQKDLADKLFVTAQAVSRWENDEVEPNLQTIKEIAKLFNVSTDSIIGATAPAEKPEEKPAAPVQEVTQVIYKETKPVLGVCEWCNTPLYNPSEIYRDYKDAKVVCKKCHDKREKRDYQIMMENAHSTRVHAYVWPSLLAAVILIIGLIVSIGKLESKYTGAGIGITIAAAIMAYTFLACKILDNNFVDDIVQWGYVEFPGIIFDLDIDGIIWAICVKILFAVLGFMLVAAATVFAAFISVFVYPYAIIHAYRHPEDCD